MSELTSSRISNNPHAALGNLRLFRLDQKTLNMKQVYSVFVPVLITSLVCFEEEETSEG